MNRFRNTYNSQNTLISLTIIWIAAVQWISFKTWFDWETVRFFVQPRSLQFRWFQPWFEGWVDLSDYGINAASLTLRPLMTWSFQLEALLFKDWAPGYHLFNFGAHLFCVYLLIRFLLKIGISLHGAILGGLLFGLHPLSTQPLWILGDRAEVCVLAGGLLTLLYYDRSRLITALSLAFALYSKETAITIPAWLLFYDLFFLDKGVAFRRTIKFRIRRILLPSVITLLYLVHRFTVFGGAGGYRSVDHARFTHILDVFLQNLAWIFTLSHTSLFLLPALILIISVIFLPVIPRPVRFGAVWFCIYLLPVHNLCNKWYLYTATAAIIVMFAGIWDILLKKQVLKPLISFILFICAGYFSIVSYAELSHQVKNSEIPMHIARQIHNQSPQLPENKEFIITMSPPYNSDELLGHYFKPSLFEVKAFKPPLESIVWDLNGTRFTDDFQPVWSRAVEAAVRLLYDDIEIRVRLMNQSQVLHRTLKNIVFTLDPLTMKLQRQDS